MAKPLVAYYRVSTRAQGALGARAGSTLSAKAVRRFAEAEGSTAARLAAALAEARRQGRRTPIVVARLDRLSRDVHFISGLMTQRVRFISVELGPDVEPCGSQLRASSATFLLVDGLWHPGQALQAVTFQKRRHIGVNARLQILQRNKTPVRQPQTIAIEAGLALGEDRLNFRADAKRGL
jgi:Resolvase, N terminal domain